MAKAKLCKSSAWMRGKVWLFFLTLWLVLPVSEAAEEGVTDDEIRLGSVLDLEGLSSALGDNMLLGMQAALKDQVIDGRSLTLLSRNDSYTPVKTVTATQALIDEGVFLFMGNVGTPTANVSLPLLAEHGIPALGFFTGSEILRPDQSLIINYRASYRQETAGVIKKALAAGIKPTEICAYVQNDMYGMSGVQGILSALEHEEGAEKVKTSLKRLLQKTGENAERNDIAPVGVYVRNTFRAREGYDSLKKWENDNQTVCKLVVTVGSYTSVGQFIAYAVSKGEPWTYSAVSFTGADNLLQELKRFEVTDRVMISQVVPSLNATEEIVYEAGATLGRDLNLVSLEGFIVGKLMLYGLEQLAESGQALTRQNFLNMYRGRKFVLGGLEMDFTDDNQGSDFVTVRRLDNNNWTAMDQSTLQDWYK